MNNEELILFVTTAQSGDREAFGKLVLEYESNVFAVVMKRLRNSAEAHEVTQEVFLRAMRKISQLREPHRFIGWLLRIAVRLSINRATRRPQESSFPHETISLTPEREPSEPWERLLRDEQAEQLRDGIDRLSDLDRETLIAFYFEGQTLKEMSDHFASPIGTIKRRLHTARHRLREQLADLQPA